MTARILGGERRAETPVRLFCLPYAGGGCSAFEGWAEDLPDFVELHAVEFPGRGSLIDFSPMTSIRGLAEAASREISRYLDRPYALFGFGMGALTAFELARELRRRSEPPPARVILAAHPAPHLPGRRPAIHDLPNDEFRKRLHELQGAPPELLDHPGLLDLLLPALRADFAAWQTYEYQQEEPLSSPMLVFGGTEDETVLESELAAWAEHTSGDFAVQMLRGGHYFLHQTRSWLWHHLAHEMAVLRDSAGLNAAAKAVT